MMRWDVALVALGFAAMLTPFGALLTGRRAFYVSGLWAGAAATIFGALIVYPLVVVLTGALAPGAGDLIYASAVTGLLRAAALFAAIFWLKRSRAAKGLAIDKPGWIIFAAAFEAADTVQRFALTLTHSILALNAAGAFAAESGGRLLFVTSFDFALSILAIALVAGRRAVLGFFVAWLAHAALAAAIILWLNAASAEVNWLVQIPAALALIGAVVFWRRQAAFTAD
jgi:hypothetical protein